MPTEPYSILVVDDLPDWRVTLRGLLTDEGYAVQVAGSSQEALALLAENHFDVAVLDVRLDETDEENKEGLDYLAVEIKKNWPEVKRIIITGYPTSESVNLALKPDEDGQRLVEDFVEKTDSDQLVQVVQNILA